MNRTNVTRPPRPLRSLRVGSILLLVALIPLVGMSAVTWSSVREARSVADAASHTEADARRAVALTKLDGAVFDEMVWLAIDRIAGTLVPTAGMVDVFLGSDPQAELAAAAERTDALVLLADRPDIGEAMRAARAADLDMRGILQTYGAISADLGSSLSTLLDDLSSAPVATDTGELVQSLQVLELSVAVRRAIAAQFYGYFASVFQIRDDAPVEIRRLVQSRAAYDESLAMLQSSPAQTAELTAAVSIVASDPGLRRFTDAVDGLIAEALASGAEPAPPLTLDSVMANFGGLSAVYVAAGQASTTTIQLLDTAAANVLGAAAAVKHDADRDIERSYTLGIALTLATVLAALLAARFIVRPLRGLQRSADDLRTGKESVTLVELTGPTEVRAATYAIHEAVSYLDLATRQARALAAGDLDAVALDESAPGGLGTALQHAVGTLRTALAQQDEFRRRLAHEAAHDGLTKLPNRNASMAQLTRSLARTTRSGSQLAVLFIDLDRFKDVNDHHGHGAGDTVLTTIAQRLVTHVREGDHVGRLGGDEFVVIAEPVHGVEEAVALAERILATVVEPIELPNARVTVGASVGIAVGDGADLTADELLRDADLAVYRAKGVGRGGIEICNEDLRNELAATADLSIAIRQAIDLDELIVHYQPIVDTRTEQVHALEALVRWQRPGHGLVPPDSFIGFAERSTLIIDLDRWVLNAVTAQIARWKGDPRFDGIPVAINVSRRHLAHDRFVDHVLEPLARHQVEPTAIIVEVTESALLDDLTAAAVKLQQLRDHGVLVSIDDFGTGYTSLAHLRSLPVDILKIDRSFTANAMTDPHEASIVKLIIDTGHLLGATITAEGVETAIEADTLAALGSDNLQGFYFARPLPPESVVIDAPPRQRPPAA